MSQMSIAPVPACRDVQWVGPVPAGGIAPDVEQRACDSRLRYSEFSRPLSAMVMKLLAKNAEDRYQTAAGGQPTTGGG